MKQLGVIVVVACGRIGFDPVGRGSNAAWTGDAPATADATIDAKALPVCISPCSCLGPGPCDFRCTSPSGCTLSCPPDVPCSLTCPAGVSCTISCGSTCGDGCDRPNGCLGTCPGNGSCQF